MYRFFIDDQEVAPPLGFEGVQLERARSETYAGFLAGAIGYTPSVQEQTFTDPLVVRMLHETRRLVGVQAVVACRVEYLGAVIFSGEIDLARLKGNPSLEAKVTLVPPRAQRDFSATAEIDYALTTTTQVLLHAKPAFAVPTHLISPTDQRFNSDSGTTSLSHAVPFDASGDSIALPDDKQLQVVGRGVATVLPLLYGLAQGLSLPPVVETALLLNAPGNPQVILRLTGLLSLSVSATPAADARFVFYFVFRKDGAWQQTRLEGPSVHLTPTESPRLLAVDQTLMMPENSYLAIRLECAAPLSSFVFDYQPETFLAVTLISPKPPAPPADPLEVPHVLETRAAALPIEAAFAALVEKMTDGKLTFRSDFLRSRGLLVCRGRHLRGLAGPVNAAFLTLWKFVNARYCLAVDLEGSTVRMEPRSTPGWMGLAGALRCTEYEESANTDFLFSSVKVGYPTWQAETALGVDEFNTTRQYQTGTTVIKKELDLTTDIVTSGYVIEEGRSRQGTETNRDDWSFDENLFVIDAVLDVAGEWESRQGSSDQVEGIYRADLAYNVDLSPARMLEAWQAILTLSGGAVYASGTGNVGMVTTRADGSQLAENGDFSRTAPPFSGLMATATVLATPDFFLSAPSVVPLLTPDGRRVDVLLTRLTFQPSPDGPGQAGPGEATLTGYLI